MFLTRMRNDHGSAMVAVLGVMAVTTIIAATVVATTINGLGVTSSTKAGVQARAAAEAGIDRALVDIQGTCVTTFESTTGPHFEYELAHKTGAAAWVNGCPPAAAEFIRIRSTGYADALGVAGASGNDTVLLEGIYSNIPVFVEVPQVDPAVYAHNMQGSLQRFFLSSSDDSIAADIQIKNGDVVCTNNATIDGSVILGNGNVSLTNCEVNGDIHVSGSVLATGNGTTVLRDILAVGTGVSGDVTTVSSGSTVKGDVYSGGDVTVSSDVEGSVTVAGSSASKVIVTGTGRIFGDLVSSGVATVATGTVSGVTSTGVVGLATVPEPQVPEWTDIPYPSSSWDGYHVVAWSGSCSVGNSHPFYEGLATLTATAGNVLVDARSCGAAGIDFQNNIREIVLSANLTFIAQTFNVDKLIVKSNTTATRNLWFMVPDNLADQQPTNYGAQACDITLTNEADFAVTIAAMVYTPCKIISDRNNWRGQFYGGSMEFLQQALMTYVQVGVPGVDFRASLPPVLNLDDSVLGSRVSLKELSSNG